MRLRSGILLIFALLLSSCQTLVSLAASTGDYQPLKVAAPNCTYGGKLKIIEALDKETVRFELCSPDPAFIYKVAFGAFAIQDSAYLYEAGGDSAKLSEKPNGTGPYMLSSWNKGQNLVLERNPNYWGVPPKSREIIFRWQSDADSRLQRLRASFVDGIDNLAPKDFELIQKDSKYGFFVRPALNVFYLGMNNNLPPFDKQEVRQAFAQAVNRKKLVQEHYPAGSIAAEQFVPPSITPGASQTLPWYEYNPEKAREQLVRAGFDFKAPLTLSFFSASRPYLPNPVEIAKAVRNDLEKIGVKVELKQMEASNLVESVAAGNEAFFMLGWSGDYPDASNFYEFHFTGASKNFGSPYPELEKAVLAGGSISDAQQRQKYYDQVNRLIKEYVPVIPVAHAYSALAFNVGVQNVIVGALNENFDEMSTLNDRIVFAQSSEPVSLWPGDETFGDTLRTSSLIYDTLLKFEYGGVGVKPSLAEAWETNKDATQWIFALRRGVKFSNGAYFDANDVVATFAAQWDASNPNHKGNTGVFEYFAGFFGEFINKK